MNLNYLVRSIVLTDPDGTVRTNLVIVDRKNPDTPVYKFILKDSYFAFEVDARNIIIKYVRIGIADLYRWSPNEIARHNNTYRITKIVPKCI